MDVGEVAPPGGGSLGHARCFPRRGAGACAFWWIAGKLPRCSIGLAQIELVASSGDGPVFDHLGAQYPDFPSRFCFFLIEKLFFRTFNWEQVFTKRWLIIVHRIYSDFFFLSSVTVTCRLLDRLNTAETIRKPSPAPSLQTNPRVLFPYEEGDWAFGVVERALKLDWVELQLHWFIIMDKSPNHQTSVFCLQSGYRTIELTRLL